MSLLDSLACASCWYFLICRSPYAVNERGTVYVLAADDSNELLATNQMNQRTLATPAVSHGDLFLRTESRLYCIAAVDSDDSPSRQDVLAKGDAIDDADSSPSPSDAADPASDAVPTLPEAASTGPNDAVE